MKNLIKVILFSVLLISAIAINAFDAVSTSEQTSIGPVVQPIVLDGAEQSFVAPQDGKYTISFNANVLNPTNRSALVTIKAAVNNTISDAGTTLQVVGSPQVVPMNFNGTLELKEDDIVTFNWVSTRASVSLVPVNNSPSFMGKINPEKPSIKL